MSFIRDRFLRQPLALGALAFACVAVMGCDKKYALVDPPDEPSLDAQVRRVIGNWGVVPIGPMAAQNPKRWSSDARYSSTRS